MRRERDYVAFCDNGHDYFHFYFTSEYKAGSRENKYDCMRQMRRKCGLSFSRNVEVLEVFLND